MSMSDLGENAMDDMIRSNVQKIMDDYDDDYWQDVHTSDTFPESCWQDLAENGWLGISIPEEYGGGGMGIREMVKVIEEVCNGGGISIAEHLLGSQVFGGEILVKHGSESLKEQWLPQIADGSAGWALGVTESEAGLETTAIDTFAEKDGDEFVINGGKIFTSRADEADMITLLARTTSLDDVDRASKGMTIFLVDPDDENVDLSEVPLEIWYPSNTFNLFLDDVKVHESQVIGEVGQGLHQIFDMLNVERIGGAALGYSSGSFALRYASNYATDREVFGSAIGSYQAISHPLADAYADIECARAINDKAARIYDDGQDASTYANIAQLKGAEAGWNASEAAMTTLGGMSASAEMPVARIWEFVRHLRTAPVSKEMIRNYLAERELGLPRSY